MFRNSTHSGESSSFLLINQFIKNMSENKNHKVIRVTKCNAYLFFVKCIKEQSHKSLIEAKNIADSLLKNEPAGTLLLNESSIAVKQWEKIVKLMKDDLKWEYV